MITEQAASVERAIEPELAAQTARTEEHEQAVMPERTARAEQAAASERAESREQSVAAERTDLIEPSPTKASPSIAAPTPDAWGEAPTSLAQPTKVHENKVRRQAERQGLTLVKSRRRDPNALGFGNYALTSSANGEPVLGAVNTPRSYPLDAVEQYLNTPLAQRKDAWD